MSHALIRQKRKEIEVFHDKQLFGKGEVDFRNILTDEDSS